MDAIRPQKGPQEKFLSTSADLAIYGGAAGGGKTWALLVEPLRHSANGRFGAVIFRRTTKQIREEGGLWTESMTMYPLLGAEPREQMLDWRFRSGARITFAGMEHEKDRLDWDGSQIALIGFDQLEHFTARQFWYMLSRNRSVCGVRPYIRATCNPDPDSWLKQFLNWWIDPATGYAIEARSGVIRWFARIADEVHWADTSDKLKARFPECEPLSATFIRARVTDNTILLAKDPAYVARLRAMPLVERERLELGNWNIRPAAGLYFRRDWFEVVDVLPADATRVRCWDLAATRESSGRDPDWTAGLRLARNGTGALYVEHVARFRESPFRVEEAICNTASADGREVAVRLFQDPGQAGKSQVEHLTRLLAGYRVTARRESGDKVTRAGPFSSQCEAGNVKIVRGAWNEAFFAELENFPEGHDDQVDAAAGAMDALVNTPPALAFN